LDPAVPELQPSELHLDLRIDAAATPITGSLRVPERRPVAFTGWAGLTAVLQDAVDAHQAGVVR
jgi:hypothetical protein